MTQSHTPGPWKIVLCDLVKDSEGNLVADCETTPRNLRPAPPKQQDMANARLIAQAPIMAQALRDLLALHIAHHNHPHHAHAREILRAIEGK